MKETLKLILVLVVICAVAGCLLAWVHKVTYEPIKATAKRIKNKAIEEVLPDHNNDPLEDTLELVEDEATWTFYVAKKDGSYTGAAFESTSSKGYGGNITIMVGVNTEGNVQGIKILDQKETPGLGAKIKTEEWRGQFPGKSISDTTWAVKKDGGDVDEITAATISSRAVTAAIKSGLEVYTRNKAQITGAGGNIR